MKSVLTRWNSFDKIPTALIITGSNIALQNLLFEQLSESLQETTRSRFVRLRSSEATNLKVTLKKIIHDVMSRVSTDDEDDGYDVR
jgi:origin recognition complex subunit 3